MKCIFLGFLLFATASASYGGGGGGYTGGYDDEYQLNGFTNGKGAVVNVLCCATWWETRYKYPGTNAKVINACNAAPLVIADNNGKTECSSGISSASELAKLVNDVDKPEDSITRRNSSMEYERRSNKCGYCKPTKQRCYNIVRQMKATCDEFRQYKVNRCEFQDPYTVKLAGGKRIWKKDYGGKSGGGYGGQWRKRSGYGNYAGYVIPRSKFGILLFTYTVYSCKRIPSNYGSGGSGYKAKRGNYYGPRCPAGHYMDYETTTIAIDTYIARNKCLAPKCVLRTPVCAEDAYAGAALPPGMRYALVPTGPNYESKSNYGDGYGGGSGSGGSWRRSVY